MGKVAMQRSGRRAPETTGLYELDNKGNLTLARLVCSARTIKRLAEEILEALALRAAFPTKEALAPCIVIKKIFSACIHRFEDSLTR